MAEIPVKIYKCDDPVDIAVLIQPDHQDQEVGAFVFAKTSVASRLRTIQSSADGYCLITVPSLFLVSPHPPFKWFGLSINGYFAASFSSISIPQPGFSFTQK